MTNRILTFIIGALTGAIIIVLVFLIFDKPNEINRKFPRDGNIQMNRPNENMGESLERPNGNIQINPR